MPWCEACSRFWNPTSLRVDGTCPACGRVVGATTQVSTTPIPTTPIPITQLPTTQLPTTQPQSGEAEAARAPWHFKVLLGGVVLYLGFRAWQGLSWLGHHL